MDHQHFYAGIRFIGNQAYCSVSLIGGPTDFGVLRAGATFEDALDSALTAMHAKLDGRDPAAIIAETSKRGYVFQGGPKVPATPNDDVDDLIGAADDDDLVG